MSIQLDLEIIDSADAATVITHYDFTKLLVKLSFLPLYIIKHFSSVTDHV